MKILIIIFFLMFPLFCQAEHTLTKACNIPRNGDNFTIKECLKEFTPPRHRIENIAKIKGVNYYNDSKGTNIGATLAIIQTFHEIQN